MAIKLNAGRQEVISAKVTFALADLTSGAAVPAVQLPANARVTNVLLKVETAFNSGTTDAVVVQSNELTPKSYLAITAGSGALSAGLSTAGSVTNLGFVNPVQSTIDVKWTGAGTAATTGTATLLVSYVVDNRAEFSQG
jgi:hypothetical protein